MGSRDGREGGGSGLLRKSQAYIYGSPLKGVFSPGALGPPLPRLVPLATAPYPSNHTAWPHTSSLESNSLSRLPTLIWKVLSTPEMASVWGLRMGVGRAG